MPLNNCYGQNNKRLKNLLIKTTTPLSSTNLKICTHIVFAIPLVPREGVEHIAERPQLHKRDIDSCLLAFRPWQRGTLLHLCKRINFCGNGCLLTITDPTTNMKIYIHLQITDHSYQKALLRKETHFPRNLFPKWRKKSCF